MSDHANSTMKLPGQSTEKPPASKSNENSAGTPKAHEEPAHPTPRVKKSQPEPEAASITLGDYFRGLQQGCAYSLTRPSVLGLIGFEAVCCVCGVAFLLLLWPLNGNGSNVAQLLVHGLLCVGIGWLIGTIGMSRISSMTSPIISYTPAFSLIACGIDFVSHAAPESSLSWTYTAIVGIGLGGGMITGRVSADLKANVEPEFRSHVLSLKSVALVGTMVVSLLVLAEMSDTQMKGVTLWMPRLLLFSLPVVFALSWIIDISMHTKNEIAGIQEFPDPFHRFGYRALRGIARAICKPLFHFEPVDSRNVPETGGVVLAANHGSFLDPILLSCGTNRLVQYVIYSSYYRSLAHPLFRFLRCIPVDEKEQLGALRASVRSLKLGACIGIFPEGEVSKDGTLHSPQRGALFLAQRSGAPVVPVALKGDFQALPRGAWIPHAATVTPIFGKPYAVDKDLPKKTAAELTDHLMADLAQKLEVESPPKIAGQVEEESESKTSASLEK